MKEFKTLVLTFVSMIMIISCSSDDSVVSSTPNTKQKAIDFNAYVGRSITRGSTNSEEFLKTEGFGVLAMYTKNGRYDPSSAEEADVKEFNPLFMNNFQVTYEDSKWVYSPIRYWPNTKDEYISFIAYAPYQSGLTLVSNEGKQEGDRTCIEYGLENNKPDKMVDWMYNSLNSLNQQLYLEEDDNQKIIASGGNDLINNKVKFNFKHATSRVAFAITSSVLEDSHNFEKNSSESDAVITINKFMLLGNKDISNPQGAFIQKGYLDINPNNDVKWTNISEDNKVYFIFNGDDNNQTYNGIVDKGSNQWEPKDDVSKSIRSTRDSKGKITVNAIGNSSSNYLFIIPQDFSNDVNNLYCYINYQVEYTSMEEGAPGKRVEYEAYKQIKTKFVNGNAYLILLDIGSNNDSGLTTFKPVELTMELEDWSK